MPRLKPPFPTERGLFGEPTLIHNVETIACVPFIVSHGGDAFLRLGRTGLERMILRERAYRAPGRVRIAARHLVRRACSACRGDSRRAARIFTGRRELGLPCPHPSDATARLSIARRGRVDARICGRRRSERHGRSRVGRAASAPLLRARAVASARPVASERSFSAPRWIASSTHDREATHRRCARLSFTSMLSRGRWPKARSVASDRPRRFR